VAVAAVKGHGTAATRCGASNAKFPFLFQLLALLLVENALRKAVRSASVTRPHWPEYFAR